LFSPLWETFAVFLARFLCIPASFFWTYFWLFFLGNGKGVFSFVKMPSPCGFWVSLVLFSVSFFWFLSLSPQGFLVLPHNSVSLSPNDQYIFWLWLVGGIVKPP